MRALALVAILLLPAAAALIETQDDAGSGGDAGGVPALAVHIGPGTHAAEFRPPADRVDVFAFDAPYASVARVRVAAPATLLVTLRDEAGDPRGFGSGTTRSLSAITEPPGRWTITVQGFSESPTAYTLTLELATYAHLERLGPWEGASHAFAIAHQPGEFSRVELYETVGAVQPGGLDAVSSIFHARDRRPDGRETSIGVIFRKPGFGAAQVQVQEGDAAADLALSRFVPPLAASGASAAFLSEDSRNWSVSWGFAWDPGVTASGWMVYDVRPPFERRASDSWFLRVPDGEGNRATAGPFARGNVTFDWSPALTHRVVLVSALGSSEPGDVARATVALPNGTTVDLEREERIWWPPAPPAGDWSARFDLSGRHGDTVRVLSAAFDLRLLT